MTTVHAYTNDQRLADVPAQGLPAQPRGGPEHHPDHHRRGPGGGQGAAAAQGQARRHGDARAGARRLDRRPGGPAARASRTRAAVNAAVREAAAGALKTIVEYSEVPLVSTDIIGNPHSSIFDALSTRAEGDGYVKVVAWYDNEWGYSNRVVDLIGRMAAVGGL